MFYVNFFLQAKTKKQDMSTMEAYDRGCWFEFGLVTLFMMALQSKFVEVSCRFDYVCLILLIVIFPNPCNEFSVSVFPLQKYFRISFVF